MRVLVVSPAYADPAARGKLRSLAALGALVTVAVPDRRLPPGALEPIPVPRAEDGGVRVVPVPVDGALDQPDDLEWDRKAVARLLSETRPDVVHVEAEADAPLASTVTSAAAKLKLPVVLQAWESVPGERGLRERLRRKGVLESLAGVIGGNTLATALLEQDRPGVPSATIRQLGVAPAADLRHEPDPEWLRIGFVSRLIPEKGLDLLFRACARIIGFWRLSVVGTGPAQEQLEVLAQQLGIAARVAWLGPDPAVLTELWPRLDCLALPARATPSWVEVQGKPVLDAMAHGVAVIGTRTGCLPELIGGAGLLVPPDDAEALTTVLQQLHDGREGSRQLGRQGRDRLLQEFTDEAVARKTLAYWRSLRAAAAPVTGAVP